MATIKDVAKAARVSTATVSAVINDSAYVSPSLRARVLEAIRSLDYSPSQLARNLRRGRNELIALVVADLANPFYAKVVWAAEAAVAAWGYSLVVFNSDEKPEAERRIFARVQALQCEGLLLVPVGNELESERRGGDGRRVPTVLFGRTIADASMDTVTIDNVSASFQATNYLLDLGHTRIGAITGLMHSSTARGRMEGLEAAMRARGLSLDPRFIRSGEFREEVAYSQARSLFEQTIRPTAIYVANGVMALGVMRAIADFGMTCPDDISIASTDNIPGIRGLRPMLTRTEHPIVDMVNEAIRLLADRIRRGDAIEPRNVVFQPSLVVGDSCAPLRDVRAEYG
jgi:LacI family transcriptional regulator